MVVIVYAATELNFLARFGYDHFANEKYDPTIPVEDQVGEGKCFPGAPVCEYRGKQIPAIVGMSKKGSMTSEILAAATDKLDELEVFERIPGGPIPTILLDAHDTRLQVPALGRWNRRIIGDDPAWKVSIGLPNGTSLWQVGNSSQPSGT